jgi:hypothetical protein
MPGKKAPFGGSKPSIMLQSLTLQMLCLTPQMGCRICVTVDPTGGGTRYVAISLRGNTSVVGNSNWSALNGCLIYVLQEWKLLIDGFEFSLISDYELFLQTFSSTI